MTRRSAHGCDTEDHQGAGVALALGALLAVSAAPAVARAATAGAFEVTGDSEGYSYSDGVLTVNDGADIAVSMADGATGLTSDRIVVAEGATTTITLDGVNITGPGPDISSGALA